MRPNKDRRTGIILYGLLLIPLLFAAAALAQATEQAQGLAEITAALSTILNNPMALKWCASTPKFLLAVLMLYPLAVYCYMLDQADRHPGAEHGTAKWGSAHRLNIKYRNTKDSKENYILTENVRFSTASRNFGVLAHQRSMDGVCRISDITAVISASPCACSVACASAAAANSSGISNSPYRIISVRRSLFGRMMFSGPRPAAVSFGRAANRVPFPQCLQ